MLKNLKPKSEFSRNVLTLMTGTTIAQAIPIAISPILTRIYTPEDFGVFALYMSIASITSVIATGRYELAIMLPKNDKDAINILLISIVLAALVSFISLGLILVFNSNITILLGNQSISKWLYVIPVSIVLTSCFQSFNHWFNRKKKFKRLAFNKVIQSSSTGGSSLGMGVVNLGESGLILGSMFGQAIVTTYLGSIMWKEYKKLFRGVQINMLLTLMKRYVSFPKFDILAALCNTGAQQIPLTLFNIYFNSTIAGYYYLTQRIMQFPINFLARSILDVFKVEASIYYSKYGEANKIFRKTFYKLLIICLPISILAYFTIIDIFIFIFGDKWFIAGQYAQIFIPMLVLRFVSSPLSFMIYIGERQKLNLYCQILLLIAILSAFLLSDRSAMNIVKIISLSFSVFYLLQLIISARIAKAFQFLIK